MSEALRGMGAPSKNFEQENDRAVLSEGPFGRLCCVMVLGRRIPLRGMAVVP